VDVDCTEVLQFSLDTEKTSYVTYTATNLFPALVNIIFGIKFREIQHKVVLASAMADTSSLPMTFI
jgi:hypothetical protein